MARDAEDAVSDRRGVRLDPTDANVTEWEREAFVSLGQQPTRLPVRVPRMRASSIYGTSTVAAAC
jgi:hypothetical protein